MWARLCAVIALVWLVGCSHDGRELDHWTIDVDGRQQSLQLPSTLAHELPGAEQNAVLRTDLVFDNHEIRHDLTLTFDCFHGAMSATANGQSLVDLGDTAVGEHRYLIEASIARASPLHLVVTARRDATSAVFGFGTAPRLIVGIDGSTWVTSFNRYTAVINLALCSAFALLFGAVFLLARHRASGAFAVTSLTILAWPLWMLGHLHVVLLMAITSVALQTWFYFLNWELGVAKPPRALAVAVAAFTVLSPIGLWSWGATRVCEIAYPILFMGWNAWFFGGVARLVGNRQRRFDALLLLAAAVLTIPTLVPLTMSGLFARPILDGLHLENIGVFQWWLAQAIVLARIHAARQREVENANAELRRQVAERSKELADALTSLAQQPAKPLGAGRTVDSRYRVIKTLGAGGMGTVYEVQRTSDGSHFALKTLRGRGDVALMARFAREAQVAADLNHPNLVPVVDVGIADGALFLVMHLVHGGPLELQRPKFGDPIWAMPLLTHIASGLAALHERGIIHRDLKPGNILLDKGVARIADFGLATLQPSSTGTALSIGDDGLADTMTAEGPKLTRAGDVFGTPAYMAPELAGGVEDVKPSSDVFAFGVVAYEMLAGKRPWVDPPVVARLSGRPLVPPTFEGLPAVVQRCVDFDASKRPSAEEIVASLRR